MAMTEKQSMVPWLIVAVLGLMLWRNQPSAPKPDPKPSVAQVVQKMMADTQAGYAREFNDAAKRVESKEIVNEEQLHSHLKGKLDEVRSAASDDLNHVLDDNIATEFSGREDAVATFLRSVANGFK